MDRRPIVIANWKMYLSAAATLRAARATKALAARAATRVDVVLCPSFPLIPAVAAVAKGSRIRVGAQDLHAELQGPYTGDVSAEHLRGLVTYAIVGHSERRRYHGETDELVAQKVRRALHAGLHPIICLGETAEEHTDGETVAVVRRQVDRILTGVPVLSLAHCVFAYEPVWAVSQGVGRPSPQPTPGDAAQVMGLIRKVAADRAGRRYAERLRVVYGGSVDTKTARAFAAEPGVDGVLVGAASTSPVELNRIIRDVLACHS
jgi:triosephosphate isomerase